MSEETFKRLPGSINAVESYNRCSKTEKPDILKVAMMYTYKVDMAAALENLEIATSYTSRTPDDSKKRAQQQSKARQKRYRKDNDNGGPPDKRRHLTGIYVHVHHSRCVYSGGGGGGGGGAEAAWGTLWDVYL